MSDSPQPDFLPLIDRHFPGFAPETVAQLGRLAALVRDWNTRVNLISRKDIGHLELHHLAHSLAASRVWRPASEAMVADLGTGGGFPGLPLAIVYPNCWFTLVDSVGKKGRAVREIVSALGLRNVRVVTGRAEEVRGKFDFIFGRAVTALPQFLALASPLLLRGAKGKTANGVLYFKGTRWREELADSRVQPSSIWDLHTVVPEAYFAEKFLLHFSAPIPPA